MKCCFLYAFFIIIFYYDRVCFVTVLMSQFATTYIVSMEKVNKYKNNHLNFVYLPVMIIYDHHIHIFCTSSI